MDRMSKAQNQRAELAEISEDMLARVRELVAVMDATGQWDHLQNFCDALHRLLAGMNEDERNDVIRALAANLAATLLECGGAPEDVAYVSMRTERHWIEIIDRNEALEVREVYLKVADAWRGRIAREQEENRGDKEHRFGKAFVGFGRLLTGGGALAFDISKMLVVMPIPQFVYATILAGAAFFWTGIQDLFE